MGMGIFNISWMCSQIMHTFGIASISTNFWMIQSHDSFLCEWPNDVYLTPRMYWICIFLFRITFDSKLNEKEKSLLIILLDEF